MCVPLIYSQICLMKKCELTKAFLYLVAYLSSYHEKAIKALFSSSLSSYHEKATEALCVGRIQTRLGVTFVSEFSG